MQKINFNTGNMKYCRWCEVNCASIWKQNKFEDLIAAKCPLEIDIRDVLDASEFEALVAAKLSRAHAIKYCSRCPWNRMDPKDSFSCVHAYNMSFCFLRDARLAVEEEMDG